MSHLICNGDEPAQVARGVIEALRQRQDEHGFIRLETRRQFALGDQIKVLDGPFSACLGLYEGMTDNERVVILLDLLGRKVRALIGRDSIAAA